MNTFQGIYRTSGVKSKVEGICEDFERSNGGIVDLSHVAPMNLACVVKLYLRKLPSPLMTYALYKEWKKVSVSHLLSLVTIWIR